MKIYTKKGDKGKTGLIGGTRVLKSNLRIDSYGTVDELNSYIGLLRDNAISDDFKKRAGSEVSDYFGKRIFPGPIMNATLSFMADQQATGEDAAIEFLTKHENIWTNWVSSDAAKKIKAGL